MLIELYAQSLLTIKMLTYDMVEGKAPILFLLDQHMSPDLQTVTTLLYRCEHLYNVRADVSKIFNQVFKIYHPQADKALQLERELKKLEGLIH